VLADCRKTLSAPQAFNDLDILEKTKHSIRMLKKAVQQAVKRESSNVKGFRERAFGSPTFHLLCLTANPFRHADAHRPQPHPQL